MSDENKKTQLEVTKEYLEKQIAESQRVIEYAQKSIAAFTQQLEQQKGVLGYAQHLLANFKVPSEAKKSDIEVK